MYIVHVKSFNSFEVEALRCDCVHKKNLWFAACASIEIVCLYITVMYIGSEWMLGINGKCVSADLADMKHEVIVKLKSYKIGKWTVLNFCVYMKNYHEYLQTVLPRV